MFPQWFTDGFESYLEDAYSVMFGLTLGAIIGLLFLL